MIGLSRRARKNLGAIVVVGDVEGFVAIVIVASGHQ